MPRPCALRADGARLLLVGAAPIARKARERRGKRRPSCAPHRRRRQPSGTASAPWSSTPQRPDCAKHPPTACVRCGAQTRRGVTAQRGGTKSPFGIILRSAEELVGPNPLACVRCERRPARPQRRRARSHCARPYHLLPTRKAAPGLAAALTAHSGPRFSAGEICVWRQARMRWPAHARKLRARAGTE